MDEYSHLFSSYQFTLPDKSADIALILHSDQEMDSNSELAPHGPEKILKFKSFTWKIHHFCDTLSRMGDNTDTFFSLEFQLDSDLEVDLDPPSWKLSLHVSPSYRQNRYLSLDITTTGPEQSFTCLAKVGSGHTHTWAEIDQTLESIRFATLRQLQSATSKKGGELWIDVKFGVVLPGIETLSDDGEEEALDNYGSLLETGVHSDFVVKVIEEGGVCTEIKVHKAILGARSRVLRKMLESGMTEPETGILTITDMSPTSVRILLYYIYTGSLDEAWRSVGDELVPAGDKYDLPKLLDFLNRHLHTACTFTNALELRRVAKLHGLTHATSKINCFVVENIEQIG